MRQFKSIAAWALCLCLLLSVFPTMALAEENDGVIHIETREDWNRFVENCRLDSWSTGKTFSIDADLDLSGCKPVPTFGGTLDGNNHILKNFKIEGEGDTQGLFRYVREGAVIRNLKVSGAVSPSGHPSTIGGLVGRNSGFLLNCSFAGLVKGSDTVGGLVGINHASGHIEKCTNFAGAVTGEHFTGGIVGENYGAVLFCTNQGQVNTQAVEPVPQLDNFDWEQLNDTKNLPACTDTGGIAGYSKGFLQNCTNDGPVGYPHLGYNVGGIVGRQSGLMLECENHATIQGRKDVGGVVGQAEPYTELRYEQSTLQRLGDELDHLSSLMNKAVDSGDDTRKAISNHLTTINDHTGNAKDSVSGLLDDIEDVGEGSVDTVNELSRRIDVFMEDLEDVTGEMEQASDRLSDGLKQMEHSADKAGDAKGSLLDVGRSIRKAVDEANKAIDAVKGRIPMPLAPDMPKLPDLSETISEIEDILTNLLETIGAGHSHLESASNALKDAVGSSEDAVRILSRALEYLENGLNDLSHSADHMSSSFSDLQDAIKTQTDLPTLELPKLPEDFHDREHELRDTLTAINDEMQRMNDTANAGGDVISDRLKDINHQFTVLTDVIRDGEQNLEDWQLVEDISQEDAANMTWGKLQNCRNLGKVEGDVNVGGVAGSMAIEYDFDPEDDAKKSGDSSMNFRYLTRAMLLSCKNTGKITSRKNCVGGVVGYMDLGMVLAAQNYGPVESTAGEQIGGIAGFSSTLIKDSWAKCTLTGIRHVGGIVGEGQDIKHCRSLVDIRDAAASFGAIAGEAKGLLSENRFISSTLGGVDGISYQGTAQPVAYADLAAAETIPSEFSQMTVTFRDGDHIIRTLRIPYGGSIPAEQIPAVPEKAGYYGAWSTFEPENLQFNAEVEAEYIPWLSAVSNPDGSVLAEGNFRPGTTLLTEGESQVTPPVDDDHVLKLCHVSLSDKEEVFTALRIGLPEGKKNAELWVLTEGNIWQRVPSTEKGSYLRMELEANEATICLVKTVNQMLLFSAFLIGMAVLLLVILLLKKWKDHQKKAAQEPKKAKKGKAKKEKKEKKHTKKEKTADQKEEKELIHQ